jgi:hypothetical protein
MKLAGMSSRVAVVWLLLGGLVGTIVVIEGADRLGAKSRHDGARDPRMLLPVPVEQLGAIEVARAGALHRFERDAAGAWFYHGVHTGSEGPHGHQTDPSTANRIEQAFAAFGRTRIERQFAVETHAANYGVARPTMLILVYRPGAHALQPLAQYAVGDVAPDTFSQYVQAVGSPTVSTIPRYQIDNLVALVEAVGGQPDQERVTGKSSRP